MQIAEVGLGGGGGCGGGAHQGAPGGVTAVGPRAAAQEPPCRFPKLEECAHFHYERVQLPPRIEVSVQTAGSGMDQSLHSQHSSTDASSSGCFYTVHVQSGDESWLLQRSLENFRLLDAQLHQCIYDRKVSLLTDLAQLKPEVVEVEVVEVELEARRRRMRRRRTGSHSGGGGAGVLDEAEEEDGVVEVLREYLAQLCIIADNSINCAPCLNWLQMDNRGHRLLVPSEESRSINTPAVAAAYSVRRYVSQARDELSLEVGDMISVIDMASPGESVWWRGKRGFQVGFFPQYCVHIIGDKVPRNMAGPPPVVGSLAMSPIKPVLRKHGKLIAFFRSFILSRPSRRRLKATGILRERVFGCDLGEHLLNSGRRIPAVLRCCAEFIEAHGILDGIYRLSGVTSNIQKLRNAFDEDRVPNLYTEDILQDIHSVASLLKMYFRELPNPLCTYQLYTSFVQAIQGTTSTSTSASASSSSTPDSKRRLLGMRETVQKLPPPHYRTLAYLMRHLARVARHSANTGMTTRNIAIVWAPNLLRCAELEVGGVAALQGVGVQAVVTEFLICYADLIFCDRLPSTSSAPPPITTHCIESSANAAEGCATSSSSSSSPKRCRPKSLAIATPTKLITLEEARTKMGKTDGGYIEVGGGPDNLPKMYHTVIELPANHRKRGLNKRSPLTWRSFFSRTTRESRNARSQGALTKAPRKTSTPNISLPISLQDKAITETDLSDIKRKLRTVKSAESLTSGHSEPNSSEMDLLAPLHSLHKAQGHNRSVSHDSYFDMLQSSHNNSEGSLLDLSEIQINFELEESEMRIFSEDESLVSSPRIQKNSATPVASHRRHHPSASVGGGVSNPSPSLAPSSGNPSPKKQARLHRHCAPNDGLLDNCHTVDYLQHYSPPNIGGVVTVVTSASKRSKLEEQLSEDIAFIDSCTTSRGESPVGGGGGHLGAHVGGPRGAPLLGGATTTTAAMVHRNYEPSSTVILSAGEASQYYAHNDPIRIINTSNTTGNIGNVTNMGGISGITVCSTTPLFTPQTPGYMPLMTESSSPGTPTSAPETPSGEIGYQTLSGRSPVHDTSMVAASSSSSGAHSPGHTAPIPHPRRGVAITPTGSPVYENVLTTISITYKSPTRTFVTPPHPLMGAMGGGGSTDDVVGEAGCYGDDNVGIYEDVGENCAALPTSVANLPIQQANENNVGGSPVDGRPRSLGALDERFQGRPVRGTAGTPITPLLTPDIDLLNNGHNSLTDLSLSEVVQLDSTSRCCTSYSLPLTPDGANVSSLDALHLLLDEDQRTASADSGNTNNSKDFLTAHNNGLDPSGLRLSLDDIMAQSFNLIEFSPCVEHHDMIQDQDEVKSSQSRPVSSSSDKRKSSEREDEHLHSMDGTNFSNQPDDNEIYQQVKYLRRSVHEINNLVLDTSEQHNTPSHISYENVMFNPTASHNTQVEVEVTSDNFDSLEPEPNPIYYHNPELLHHTAIESTQEAEAQPFAVYENVDFYTDSLEGNDVIVVEPNQLHTALITEVHVQTSGKSDIKSDIMSIKASDCGSSASDVNYGQICQSDQYKMNYSPMTEDTYSSTKCHTSFTDDHTGSAIKCHDMTLTNDTKCHENTFSATKCHGTVDTDIGHTATVSIDKRPSITASVIARVYERDALPPCIRARNLKKHNLPVKTRSLDEDEFTREVIQVGRIVDLGGGLEGGSLNRRKSFDDNFKVNSLPKSLNKPKRLPPLDPIAQHDLHNLHSKLTEHNPEKQQQLENNSNQTTTQQLNRERIERYKEERRRFLHEKYKSESFRSTEKIPSIIEKIPSIIEKIPSIIPKVTDPVVLVEPTKPTQNDVKKSENDPTKPEVDSVSVRDTIRKIDSSAVLPIVPTSSSSSIRSRTALFESPQAQLRSTLVKKPLGGTEMPVLLLADRRRHTYEAGRDRDMPEVGGGGGGGDAATGQKVLEIRRTSMDAKGGSNRKEKMSPSYNIRDMKAIFESKSQQECR